MLKNHCHLFTDAIILIPIKNKETDRRDEMIYKVYYQELKSEIPVRERTKSLYIEAETERAVRDKVVDRNVNIEFIQQLDDAHLAYEKKSDSFSVENV